MGNGNCNRCKCNNCDNGEKKIIDENNSNRVFDIIHNDSYINFEDDEINLNLNQNDNTKTIQAPKNLENEKNTTNNQENITENRKEKLEIENNNISINNNEKSDTVNNNIIINDKDIKNEESKDILKSKNEEIKDKEEEKEEKINQENNIHIVDINQQNFKNSKELEEIHEKNQKSEETHKIKGKIEKTRNIQEFDIKDNDFVYITNKNSERKDFQNQNINNEENKEFYDYKYEYHNYANNISSKNTKNTKDIAKYIDIYNIIPKNKLHNLNNNSIICNSILEKIIKIPEKNKIIYNERFCVLKKNNFSYYKSKESYLNLANPLLSIDLKNIIKVEQTILDDTSYYFGLICSINDDTKKYIDKINTFINIGENNSEEFLLGFRSKNKDLIIKWITILNYFIENYD